MYVSTNRLVPIRFQRCAIGYSKPDSESDSGHGDRRASTLQDVNHDS